MTNNQKQTGIGKTALTYLELWVKSQIYDKTVEIKSKYLEKGNLVEAESIQFINKVLGTNYQKNEQQFENEYLTGTPDIIDTDYVIDVKNSFDWTTFPLFGSEPENEHYNDQLQGYMDLTGKSKAKLIYVLSDTPEEMIEREAWYKCKDLGLFELDFNIVQQFKNKMTYNCADNLRYKIFEIQKDENRIYEIKKRVELCRAIIETNYNIEKI